MLEHIPSKMLHYDASTKTFSGDAAEIEGAGCVLAETVTVKSFATGVCKSFKCISADTDGEDIYGWNYASADGYKLLIIND